MKDKIKKLEKEYAIDAFYEITQAYNGGISQDFIKLVESTLDEYFAKVGVLEDVSDDPIHFSANELFYE